MTAPGTFLLSDNPMGSVARELEPVTIAEFDDYVERQGDDSCLFELLDGVIVMMPEPTLRHAHMVGNFGAPLKLATDRRGGDTFLSGLRVQRDGDERKLNKPRPDVIVRLGPSNRETDLLTYVDDPVVVIEVLRPTSIDIVRGRKLVFYQSLETLQHIVIVYQNQMRIEHTRRGADGWTMTALTKPEHVLDLDAVAFTMTAEEAYLGVDID